MFNVKPPQSLYNFARLEKSLGTICSFYRILLQEVIYDRFYENKVKNIKHTQRQISLLNYFWSRNSRNKAVLYLFEMFFYMLNYQVHRSDNKHNQSIIRLDMAYAKLDDSARIFFHNHTQALY